MTFVLGMSIAELILGRTDILFEEWWSEPAFLPQEIV